MRGLEVAQAAFLGPQLKGFLGLFPALQQCFISNVQQDITEIRGAVRQREADHLHWVITCHADTAFCQGHTRILTQGHAVVDVIAYHIFIAGTGHQRLANTVAHDIPVTRIDVGGAGFVGRGCCFAEFSQQLVLGLLNGAVQIGNTLRLQVLVAVAEHGKQIINAVEPFTLFCNHLGTDGVSVYRILRRILRRRVLRIAGGGVARRGDHITNAFWHLLKFLNTF